MADDRLSETWMWERAQALLQQADRMHRQFFQLGPGRGDRAVWEPPVDVYEAERALIVVVALPGVAPDSVEALLEGTLLVVRGERAQPEPCRSAKILRMEIPHGRFLRRLELGVTGPYELELLRRELREGCLFLEIEKRPA